MQISLIPNRALALIYLKNLLALIEIRCYNKRVVVVSLSFVSTSLSEPLHIGGELLCPMRSPCWSESSLRTHGTVPCAPVWYSLRRLEITEDDSDARTWAKGLLDRVRG